MIGRRPHRHRSVGCAATKNNIAVRHQRRIGRRPAHDQARRRRLRIAHRKVDRPNGRIFRCDLIGNVGDRRRLIGAVAWIAPNGHVIHQNAIEDHVARRFWAERKPIHGAPGAVADVHFRTGGLGSVGRDKQFQSPIGARSFGPLDPHIVSGPGRKGGGVPGRNRAV